MRFVLKHAILIATLSLLAACATTSHEQASENSSPLRAMAVWAGFATNPPEAADFVKASRPQGNLDYLPVGVTPAEPTVQAKKLTPAELKALEDELEVSRQKNATAAGVSP